ncbi:Ectonucleoside triphosphate diphosphohydrolase [Fasciola gigantica]|uniref:Ectonucleoside triphosphate diphosphohydrolase n=1 Tax=Fasciola gigantica TaxID=46835 RepID=A0A504Z6I5_FASGI|nr:Ectonucleoside triphosphate diphosphohydrolase [Fasciola gigantica]
MDIPMSRWKDVPVYLAATAGMRLTLLDNPLGSLDLFEALRRGLQTSGLQVETPNERIRMLSGTEEGLYGWVSVNSILGLITARKRVSPLETVGSLDLGGASTQIAFVPVEKPSNLASSFDFHSLRLFGHQYTVYSHSFLCYGKNELEKRTMGSIASKQSSSPNIPNPCYPTGYISPSKLTSELFSGACMSGKYAFQVFKNNLTKPSSMGDSYQFTGTGNPTECLQHINQQFDSATCSNPPCSFNNVHQPPTRGPFRAYAGFSYVMSYLFPKKNTGFTKSEVLDAVNTFCRKSWSDIVKDTPQSKQSFLASYCFDGLYVYSLLDHYGFKTEDSWKEITFGTKIKGVSVSWALGYMLDQSGFLPSESPKLNLPLAAFIPLAILFSLMILVGVLLLAITLCNRKNNPK